MLDQDNNICLISLNILITFCWILYGSDREKLQVNHFEGVERVLLLLLIDVDRDKTKKP